LAKSYAPVWVLEGDIIKQFISMLTLGLSLV
jgi:hypothetical protein